VRGGGEAGGGDRREEWGYGTDVERDEGG